MRVNVDGRTLSISNLDKQIYPDGTTKGEIIDYYTRMSPYLLPHLAGRQVTRKRFPESAMGEGFFEKNAPSWMPKWVERSPEGLVMCPDLSTLVYLANLAALELHVPQWKVGYEPDRMVFDL